MEKLSINNIDTKALIDAIKSHESVKELDSLSKDITSKFKDLDEIKNSINKEAIENFKNALSEVNELSSYINDTFKKELSI
ncbi:hypothetical protein J6Y73_05220 [bacterium]|nr:hypothetical protein [bacterium]